MTSVQALLQWFRRLLLCGVSVSLACLPAIASTENGATVRTGEGDDAAVIRRGYHLFNPVPTERLRMLSTDRPDRTESPYTVDAGHVQIETELFSYTRDYSRAERLERYRVATTNLKAGLLSNLDVQLILEPYTWEHSTERVTGMRKRQSGFGDLLLRFKLNCWGNDGGATAFAITPFLKIPTNQAGLGNNAVEGGIILPLAVKLPWGWDMGVMTEVDINQDADGNGHHPEFINTITMRHDIVGKLSGYVEFFSLVSTDREAQWIGTIDIGLIFQLTENIQLDAGVNIGVTPTAEDLNPFLGISLRL
jgi:hypothetical protein